MELKELLRFCKEAKRKYSFSFDAEDGTIKMFVQNPAMEKGKNAEDVYWVCDVFPKEKYRDYVGGGKWALTIKYNDLPGDSSVWAKSKIFHGVETKLRQSATRFDRAIRTFFFKKEIESLPKYKKNSNHNKIFKIIKKYDFTESVSQILTFWKFMPLLYFYERIEQSLDKMWKKFTPISEKYNYAHPPKTGDKEYEKIYDAFYKCEARSAMIKKIVNLDKIAADMQIGKYDDHSIAEIRKKYEYAKRWLREKMLKSVFFMDHKTIPSDFDAMVKEVEASLTPELQTEEIEILNRR